MASNENEESKRDAGRPLFFIFHIQFRSPVHFCFEWLPNLLLFACPCPNPGSPHSMTPCSHPQCFSGKTQAFSLPDMPPPPSPISLFTSVSDTHSRTLAPRKPVLTGPPLQVASALALLHVEYLYFRDSKGRPRQDGGALGAQVLGRRLGAPVGAQRVPGGDGEAASRARAREKRGGARDARLAGPGPGGWGWFPPRSGPAGRVAVRCTARGSLPSNELQPSLWPRRILEEKSWILRLAPSFLSLAKPSVQWNESPKQ